jgi:hypothetical protein
MNKKLAGGGPGYYDTLEDMLKHYNIKDLRSLINLSDEELEALIAIIQINDGKVELKDLLREVPDENEKIKILINELAKKLCSCRTKIGQNYRDSQKIAICITSIFHKKGITIPRFQCEPIPMLLPKKKGKPFLIKNF